MDPENSEAAEDFWFLAASPLPVELAVVDYCFEEGILPTMKETFG